MRVAAAVTAFLLAAFLALAGPAGGQAEPPPAPAPAPVVGVSIVFDPSNFAENVRTAFATIEAIRQRVEMIRQQIRQVEWMLANVEHLDDPLYRQVGSLLSELEALMEQETRGLIYSLRDLSSRFERVYPDFVAADDLREAEIERAETTLETLRAALISTHRMAEDARGSQHTLEQMKHQALSTDGLLEMLQAQALMSAYVGEEVSKLLQQVSVQTNLQAVYFAQGISTETGAEETLRQALASSRRSPRAYEAVRPIPVVPSSLPPGVFGPRP